MPRLARLVLVAAAVLLAAQFAHAVLGLGPHALFDDYLYCLVDLLAAVLCIARGVTRATDRAAWLVLGSGVLAWTVADALGSFALAYDAPTPSVADAFFLAFYPCALVGVLLLARQHIRLQSWAMRLDGVIAGLGLAALVTALLLGPALVVHGSSGEVATNVAYIIADVVLVGIVGAMTITGGRRSGAPWLVLGAGLLTLGVADAVYLLQVSNGAYDEGLIDVLWLVGLVLMGWAAWRYPAERSEGEPSTSRSRALPVVFGAIAIVILVIDHVSRAHDLAVALAGATLVAVLARLMLTAHETDSLLRATRQDAMTDPLTGLSNRRALLDDLDRACHAQDARPAALIVFDLNGFKHYNDSFGHPAGDALLVRIGHRLRDAEHGGTAYRLGGDEFCVLALLESGDAAAPVVEVALAALSEHGEGFSITSAHGYAIVPQETDDPGEAMRIADRRMYAHKHALSGGEEVYTREALRTVEHGHPDLVGHQDRVAALARATARAMNMTVEEIDVTVRAAELHDIGKVAIPDEILSKPEALTAEEWEFVHRHTIVGERILASTPSLAPVGRIVRSSHERWDGGGYPDGVAGDKIPLGARVVAVCDAYDVITTGRVYKAAIKPAEAIAELVRHSGTQFDPAVVEVFVRHVYPSAGSGKMPATTDEPLAQPAS
jgi:diguanylate cyclase (GGDEF)-like protein